MTDINSLRAEADAALKNFLIARDAYYAAIAAYEAAIEEVIEAALNKENQS